jgi:hypothetical protein
MYGGYNLREMHWMALKWSMYISAFFAAAGLWVVVAERLDLPLREFIDPIVGGLIVCVLVMFHYYIEEWTWRLE